MQESRDRQLRETDLDAALMINPTLSGCQNGLYAMCRKTISMDGVITPHMIALATESIPTLKRMVRESGEPATAFQAKRLLALLPPAEWEGVKTTLQACLGETLDLEALEHAVASVRQELHGN